MEIRIVNVKVKWVMTHLSIGFMFVMFICYVMKWILLDLGHMNTFESLKLLKFRTAQTEPMTARAGPMAARAENRGGQRLHTEIKAHVGRTCGTPSRTCGEGLPHVRLKRENSVGFFYPSRPSKCVRMSIWFFYNVYNWTELNESNNKWRGKTKETVNNL